MKRPTLLYNIGIAVIMTVVALLAGSVLRSFFSGSLVSVLTLSLLTIIYIGHLLSGSGIRAGKITLGLICLTVLIATIFMKVNLSTLLIISIGLIWITRSLLYYSSFLPAIADMGLCMMSLAGAIWGFFISGSVAAAIWCFFLTQALSALIPKRFNRHLSTETTSGQDRFNQAYQSAETAIRHLARK